MMTEKLKLLFVISGSMAALFFALFTQKVWGLRPCELCIWQRVVYAGVIFFGLLVLVPQLIMRGSTASLFGFSVKILLIGQVALAIFHTGIEQHWWEGFSSCSTGVGKGLTLEEIQAKLAGTPLVRCDDIAWQFLGLSMAAWNAIYAFCLLIISFLPCRKSS